MMCYAKTRLDNLPSLTSRLELRFGYWLDEYLRSGISGRGGVRWVAALACARIGYGFLEVLMTFGSVTPMFFCSPVEFCVYNFCVEFFVCWICMLASVFIGV